MALFVFLLQCFDTIGQAYTYVDWDVIEDAINFVHTGIHGYVCFLLQCFDTIEQAYTYVDSEVIEDAIIFVHSGIYGYVCFSLAVL